MIEHAFWVICSFGEGKIIPAAYELLGKARQLADTLEKQVIGLILGETDEANKIIYAGADMAVVVQTDSAVWQDDAAIGTVVSQVLKAYTPDIVLFVANIRGRCIAPWVAAKLKTGLTADCTRLSLDENGLLLQTRPAFGGNLMADILCCHARPQMASVRPKIFPLPIMDKSRKGCIFTLPVQSPTIRVRCTAFKRLQEKTTLQDAEIIVAGGKGVGSRVGFQKLTRLAELLGGTLGATRSAVDAGFAGYDRQIGQTGVIVRPRIYLAFGISGMVQHIVGMSGAEYVVAVNLDRQAPIFNYCNYGIISDWEPVADRMIEELEKEKKL